jgi:hypothetical protein
MDARTADTPDTAPSRGLAALSLVGAVVLLYLAISAVLEATTAIDVPFVNWPF